MLIKGTKDEENIKKAFIADFEQVNSVYQSLYGKPFETLTDEQKKAFEASEKYLKKYYWQFMEAKEFIKKREK